MTATTITVPLLGFAPDLDPATPGVLFAVNQMEATRRGWRLARALTTSTGPNGTTGGVSAGTAASSYFIDGFRSRTTAGTEVLTLAYYDATATKVKLFVNESGTLTDESRGAFYTLGNNVTFCQFGNYTIACTNIADVVQIRDASTANSFADSAATGIPKAKICVTAGLANATRVFLLHYDDGTVYPNGVWWSGLGGPTAAWTADIATQAGNQRLEDCGEITAGIGYGNDIVIWGARSMWLGRDNGPPELFKFYKLSDEIGCVGPSACKVVNGILYWVGKQGLFQFDGQRVSRAPFPIQSVIVGSAVTSSTQLVRDDTGERLIICIGQRSATLNLQQTAYSINLVNGKVGAVGRKSATQAFQGMVDGPYYVAFTGSTQVFTAYTESSVADNGTLGTTGFELTPIGSDRDHTAILGVIPRFSGINGASGDPGSFRLDLDYGDTFTEVIDNTATSVNVTASPWRAAIRQAARWIKPQLTFTYNGEEFEVIDVLVEVEGAGKR